jgi:hypothetical protein
MNVQVMIKFRDEGELGSPSYLVKCITFFQVQHIQPKGIYIVFVHDYGMDKYLIGDIMEIRII